LEPQLEHFNPKNVSTSIDLNALAEKFAELGIAVGL